MEKQNGVQNGINVGLLKYCYSNDSIIWESRSRFTKFKTLLVEKTVIVQLGESQPRYSDPHNKWKVVKNKYFNQLVGVHRT